MSPIKVLHNSKQTPADFQQFLCSYLQWDQPALRIARHLVTDSNGPTVPQLGQMLYAGWITPEALGRIWEESGSDVNKTMTVLALKGGNMIGWKEITEYLQLPTLEKEPWLIRASREAKMRAFVSVLDAVLGKDDSKKGSKEQK